MKWCIFIVLSLAAIAAGSNCSRTSVGFTSLIDMVSQYEGQHGKLYPASNNVPPNHLASAMSVVSAMGPLDSAGNPSAGGKIVWFSVGMSNTNGKTNNLIPKTESDSLKASNVKFVNGANGGIPVEDMVDPLASYWINTVPGKLSSGGVTAEQVQIVWLLQTNRGPSGQFFSWASDLKDDLGHVCRNTLSYFPNLKIIYLTSRSYAGYADGTLNPEPYAYQSGFSVKWLIEDQINGDSALNWDSSVGPVQTGLLLWGSYIWADGTTPNSEGLSYQCSDYDGEGTHPSSQGYGKIGDKLLSFYQTDQTCTWYRGTSTPPSTSPSPPTSPPPIQTTQTGGEQCDGYSGSGSCLADCECGGCMGGSGSTGCVPATYQNACTIGGGTWYPGVSPCGSPPTSETPTPTSDTPIPTSDVGFDCSQYNNNPEGCRGNCLCGFCSKVSEGCGCITGDASGPDASHGCTCSGKWQFFGPCE